MNTAQAVPPTSSADPVLNTAASYRAAVADYINAMSGRDGSFPDTVYIGRHDEFPHIELPANIGHTSVRIIEPAEAGAVKNGGHFAYLNVFGWFTRGKAEFFVVNYKQGMSHRPDGADDRHLYYSIGSSGAELELDSLR